MCRRNDHNELEALNANDHLLGRVIAGTRKGDLYVFHHPRVSRERRLVERGVAIVVCNLEKLRLLLARSRQQGGDSSDVTLVRGPHERGPLAHIALDTEPEDETLKVAGRVIRAFREIDGLTRVLHAETHPPRAPPTSTQCRSR